MTLFSSVRERRLWVWTTALVVGIYSTLGLARTLAGVLRDRGLFDGAFILGFFLIIMAIIVQAVRTRRNGFEIGVMLAFVAVYIMVFARMGIPEERTHLFEYSAVALFILEALRERRSQGRRVPLPALVAIGMTSVLGTIDEVIQWFLPNRVFDPIDIGFNVLAAVMAVTASVTLGWVRQRTTREDS